VTPASSNHGHGNLAIVAVDRDHVIAAGRVDDDRVGRTVGSAVYAKVDIDLADVGAGEVVDRDLVSARPRY